MAKNAQLTSGTEIFFIERGQSGDEIIKICAESFTPGSAQREKIDVTTLCETEVRQFVSGLKGESQSSFSVFFTHESAEQRKLIEAVNNGKIYEFRLGDSSSRDAPSYDSAGGTWTLPRTRGWFKFAGEISDIEWGEIAPNNVMRATIHINIREDYKPIYQ